MSPTWKIYDPEAEPATTRLRLPDPPPWRRPGTARHKTLAATFQATDDVVQAVNVALHLRRPLLVTGKPGTGKSSLVYAVAAKLGLGSVLSWNINSRSSLADGLYRYDALARLQHIQQQQAKGLGDGGELGDFITLGPLGTALAAKDKNAPRALLIDEIDKSDVDLPNDLLAALDLGRFPIPELQRTAREQRVATVRTDDGETAEVEQGIVSFEQYPFIVMTSNGERDFPAAFLRRCVQCELKEPGKEQLREILAAHLPEMMDDPGIDELIRRFVEGRAQSALANDQLLSAVHLEPLRQALSDKEKAVVLDVLFRSLES